MPPHTAEDAPATCGDGAAAAVVGVADRPGRWRSPRSWPAGGYLVWRWGFTLEGSALWLGDPARRRRDLRPGDARAAHVLVLAPGRAPDAGAPRRAAASPCSIATFDEDEDVLRPTVVGALAVRNDVPPEVWVLDDGGRALGARRCATSWARATCAGPAPRAPRQGRQHQPRPRARGRRVHRHPRRRPRAAPRADRADARPHGRPAGRDRPGARRPSTTAASATRAREDDPLRNEQSIFFDVICRGKDRHGAAFWCGCPSLLRREALVEVGGVATETVVEDAHTSLKLNAARLEGRLPRRGHGPRPGPRGDRRLRRAARPLGARLAADAAARAAPVQARPHLAPAARVHGELPPLPGGPAAPDRASWCRRSCCSTGAVPIAADAPALPGDLRAPSSCWCPSPRRP